MAEFLNERPRQIPNLYWQPGQLINVPLRTFRQFKFIPLSNALPDLDQALAGARVDCARDLHKQLIEFGGAAKVWMTIQVEYEPVNLLANKQPFEQYLSAAPTRMFRRDGPFSAFTNPYIDILHILTDRIREFTAEFIKDKSGLRLSRVLQFTLKMVKYAPLERGGWQPLPEFLSKNEAIINIRNTDERCFGYSVLYFLERANLPDRNKNCIRSTLYKKNVSTPQTPYSPLSNFT